MKINESSLLLLLSGILTGVVITSFIVNASSNRTVLITYQQYQNMSMEISQVKYELNGLYKEYNELSGKLSKYDLSSEKDKSVIESLEKDLNEVRLFYGTNLVEGPGVKVTLNDNYSYSNGMDVIEGIVHNFDIFYMINDLKNAGAEAISVNGKRITGSSAVTCEGPTVKINGEYMAPPFEIMAIGDPEAMAFYLSQPESYYSVIRVRGLNVKYEKKNKIVINGLLNS